MPRGGKRPGAGAPKGNMNAFKHGRYSQQMAELGAAFFAHPKLRDAVLHLTDRANIKARKDEKRIAVLFASWLAEIDRRARKAATDRARKSPRQAARSAHPEERASSVSKGNAMEALGLNLDASILDSETITPEHREKLLAQVQKIDGIIEENFPGTIINQKPATTPKNRSDPKHENPLIEPTFRPD